MGYGGNTESIRLPPVAHDTFLGQPLAQRPSVLADADGHLRAAPFFFVWSDNREFVRHILIQ